MSQLAEAWREAMTHADAAWLLTSKAEDDAMRVYPERPPETILREAHTREPWAPPRAWLEQHHLSGLLAALDGWNAECARIDASFGVPALRERAEDASWIVDDLADRIAAMRPADAIEAALKFGVLLHRFGDGPGRIGDAGPFFAFQADLDQLARSQA
jgi:hypothetical protein